MGGYEFRPNVICEFGTRFQRMPDELENRSIFFPTVLTEIYPKPSRKRNSDNCGVFWRRMSYTWILNRRLLYVDHHSRWPDDEGPNPSDQSYWRLITLKKAMREIIPTFFDGYQYDTSLSLRTNLEAAKITFRRQYIYLCSSF